MAHDAHAPTEVDRRLEAVGLWGSLAVVTVAAVVRLPTQSFWIDEAFTLAAIDDPATHLRSSRSSMLLYMGIVWVWGQLSIAAWWVRVPSVLASVATLVLLRPVARRIGGSPLVAVALPFTALLVGFQWATTTARAYSLEMALTVGAWACLFAAGDAGPRNRRWSWLLAAVSVAGVMTHGLFVLQLLPIALVTVLRHGMRRAIVGLAPTVVASSLTLTMFLVAGTDKNGMFTPGGVDAYVGSTLDALFSPRVLPKVLLVEFALVGLVVTYLRIRRRGGRREWRAMVPALWVIIPPVALAFVDVVEPVDSPRYVLAVLPGLGLLLGQAVVGLAGRLWQSERVSATRPSVFGLAAVALPVGVLLVATVVTTPYPTHADWRGVVDRVARDARPGDGIVFADAEGQFPQFTRPAFEATWGERARAVTPEALSPARPLGRVRARDHVLGPTDVAEAAAGHPRVWFVQRADGGVPDRIAPITESPSMAGFHRAGVWDHDGSIRVELWIRPFDTPD